MVLARRKVVDYIESSFFNNIVSEINEAKSIVLFGPAETSIKFNKELLTNNKQLSTKVKKVVKADSMTKRQVKAWVKKFYKLTP